jgi:DNA-binding CsgD family transcriptional regulator
LAPHIRHAVAISDVLDQQAITIGTLEASLDTIQIGVVLVDRNGQIIHANRAAQLMFNAGFPVRSERGEIRAFLSETSATLRSAIAAAADDETAIGRIGIGVPAPQADGDPAIIHVLPLTGGKVRTRIAPRATAALFITTAIENFGTQTEALAALFDLTSAESRLLASLLDGNNLTNAAKTLGVAITTAKTHLAHIFEKTGTSRQVELVSLAARLSLPIGRPAKKDK